VRTIIFDLDGTLVDSLDDITASLNHVFGELGFDAHSRAATETFIGDGARMLIRRALGPERRSLEDEVLERYRLHYGAHLTDHTRIYPGIDALLHELSRRGVTLAVLSNKPHEMTVEVVRELLPAHDFAAVFGQRETVPRKPDPAAAIEIAGMLDGPFAFVGDTPVDMATAIAAQMRPIGVSWGMRDGALLEEAGAETVLAQPSDLLALLPDA